MLSRERNTNARAFSMGTLWILSLTCGGCGVLSLSLSLSPPPPPPFPLCFSLSLPPFSP